MIKRKRSLKAIFRGRNEYKQKYRKGLSRLKECLNKELGRKIIEHRQRLYSKYSVKGDKDNAKTKKEERLVEHQSSNSKLILMMPSPLGNQLEDYQERRERKLKE